MLVIFCCSASFHIFILEQSRDGRKFNRGKLLNAGFDMSCNDYDVYIFHDVDLLPEVGGQLHVWIRAVDTQLKPTPVLLFDRTI